MIPKELIRRVAKEQVFSLKLYTYLLLVPEASLTNVRDAIKLPNQKQFPP